MPNVPTPAMWWAGSDYLRLTLKEGAYVDAAAIYRKAAYAVVGATTEDVSGFERWAWRGYVGERCGSVAYGSGPQGSILQVAGWQAQEEVLLSVPFDNIPRWDVQLTVWFTVDVPYVAGQCALESDEARRKVAHRPWKVAMVEGFGSGDTTYIGSRSSDSFIRIYDKWREADEAEEWRYSWRFEVEFKDGAANANWPETREALPSPDWYAALVVDTLRARGTDISHLVKVQAVRKANSPAKATTVESRLAWLRNQVAPTVDKLLAKGVQVDTVLEALGLAAPN